MIFASIFQLKEPGFIKEQISSCLKFRHTDTDNTKQFLISSKTAGVRSLYYGHEITVKMVSDRGAGRPEGWPATVIRFVKIKPWYSFLQKHPVDPFYSIKHQIDIHFLNPELEDILRYQLPLNAKNEELFVHKAAKNPSWREPKSLSELPKVPINLEPSPLSIYIREMESSLTLDFRFFPECYRRDNQQTVLNNNWKEILNQ